MVLILWYSCKISNKHTPKRCFQTKKILKNSKKQKKTHTKKTKNKKQKKNICLPPVDLSFHIPQTTLQRKIIYNGVRIFLGQHCTRKSPMQCWAMANRQLS